MKLVLCVLFLIGGTVQAEDPSNLVTGIDFKYPYDNIDLKCDAAYIKAFERAESAENQTRKFCLFNIPENELAVLRDAFKDQCRKTVGSWIAHAVTGDIFRIPAKTVNDMFDHRYADIQERLCVHKASANSGAADSGPRDSHSPTIEKAYPVDRPY